MEPTEEVHLETTEENMTSEQPEVRPIARQQKRRRGDEKKKKMSSFQTKLIPSGKSTMQAKVLWEKGDSVSSSPRSKN